MLGKNVKMPKSKHHRKKMPSSVRRKRVNYRKAILRFLNSPKRMPEKRTMTQEARNEKFYKIFPKWREVWGDD